MKQKTIIIILICLIALVLLGLFAYAWDNIIDPSSETAMAVHAWNGTPPEYRGETVLELYLIDPVAKTCLRAIAVEPATRALEALPTYQTQGSPSAGTDCGFLVVTTEKRYPLYIVESGETERGQAIRALWAEAAVEAVPTVDAYQLLLPSQIDRITFEGPFTLDLQEPADINRFVKALQGVETLSSRLYPEGEEAQLPEGSIEDYSFTLHLGEIYGGSQVRVRGASDAFAMQLDFQRQQRLYTCSPAVTQALIDALVDLLRAEVPPEEPSQMPEPELPESIPEPEPSSEPSEEPSAPAEPVPEPESPSESSEESSGPPSVGFVPEE